MIILKICCSVNQIAINRLMIYRAVIKRSHGPSVFRGERTFCLMAHDFPTHTLLLYVMPALWSEIFFWSNIVFFAPNFVLNISSISITGKSLSEELVLTATNPQYDKRLFMELQVEYMKTKYKLRTCCVQKLLIVFVFTFRTIYVFWRMFSPNCDLHG